MALIGQAVSEEKIFEYYGNLHVYCPGMGHITSKKEENSIKIEGAGVATKLKFDFQTYKGSYVTSKNREDPIKIGGARVATML